MDNLNSGGGAVHKSYAMTTTPSELSYKLRMLMASVKVLNPMARDNPEVALQAMTELCQKFPAPVVASVCADLASDDEAVWPTTGEMRTMLMSKANPPQETREPESAWLGPEDIERIVLTSPAGQRALGMGVGNSMVVKADRFLGKAKTIDNLRGWLARLDERFFRQLQAASSERKAMAAEVTGKSIPEQITRNLSAKMDEKEARLVRKYGKTE